jgi:hypothetical protein
MFMDRRGSPEIRAIDNCVDEYSKLASNPGSKTMDLWYAAVNLLEAIEVYLATKRGHNQNRVDAVNLLKMQTSAVLAKLRWQKFKDVTGGHKPGMKPMDEHVWSEMHSPGHARVGHGENQLDPDPWLKGDADAKEKYLFEYLRRVRADGPKPDNVLYIEDSEKWKYQVIFSETGLACERSMEQAQVLKNSSNPITTRSFDNLSTVPYAMDEDGVFYTETSHHSGGTLNHCSFLSGKPVKCAGNIGITNGIVGYIDNGSGHYRPSVENLLKCLKALKDQASPLCFDAIIVRNHAGLYPKSAYLAGKFLATHGKCLPIGYYPNAGPDTHYKKDLVEFANSSEIPPYLEREDRLRDRTRLEKELKALIFKLENSRVKDPQTGRDVLSGKLENDADRRVLQAILSADFIPTDQKDGLKRYYLNDAPMQKWVRDQERPKVDLNRPRSQTA